MSSNIISGGDASKNWPPRELNQGGVGTAELVFTKDGTLPIICRFPSAGQIAGAQGPARKQSGRFKIRAWGRVTGGGTANYTPQLQYGTSATPGSNTDICSGSAIAVNSVAGIWGIEVDGWVDNESGKMDGFMRFFVSGSTRTMTDWAAFSNIITSVNPDGGAELGFVVTGTFSAGFVGNLAYLDGFQLELLG